MLKIQTSRLECEYRQWRFWHQVIKGTVAPDWPESGMVGLTFTSTNTADGKQNFKTCIYFLNLEFGSPSGILPTLSALNAIRGFRMPCALKGI